MAKTRTVLELLNDPKWWEALSKNLSEVFVVVLILVLVIFIVGIILAVLRGY